MNNIRKAPTPTKKIIATQTMTDKHLGLIMKIDEKRDMPYYGLPLPDKPLGLIMEIDEKRDMPYYGLPLPDKPQNDNCKD